MRIGMSNSDRATRVLLKAADILRQKDLLHGELCENGSVCIEGV